MQFYFILKFESNFKLIDIFLINYEKHSFMRKNRPIIELPRIIDISYNAIENLEDTIQRLNLPGKCAIIVDENTRKIAGNRVEEILSKNWNAELMIVDKATVEETEVVEKNLRENKFDFAIAVGGGSVIDIVKYSSFQASIPFISVPTVASHDGIASARASLVGSGKKHSFQAHSPIAVVADVETIAKAPRRFFISGSADLLSNLTAVMDWKLSYRITGEHISQYAVALSEMTAQTIMNEADIISKDQIEGTYTVLKGLITSSMAMCIAGSSRPASGAEHMISHMIDETTQSNALHGEQCGIASVITMYLHGGDWKIIKKTLEKLNAPLSLKQLNIHDEEMVSCITNAQSIRRERYSILSGGISEKAAIKALEFTGFI